MHLAEPRFVAVADHALLVEFASEIGDPAHDAVARLDRALATAEVDGVIEVVPAYVNLLVDFDPLATDHANVESAVRELLATDDDGARVARTTRVSVCYDAALAPDLADVADASALGVDAVIAAHLAGDYRVIMYGFAPGCAYMAGVPEAIRVPRKPAPVRGVAAGSVIIAGPQCMVTSIEMPIGWSIIGRSATPVLLDDPARPFLFDLDDRVVFERIDLATYERMTTGPAR